MTPATHPTPPARRKLGGGTRRVTHERVTVVLNTYKRPDMLRLAAAHYASCGDVVDAVRVVWTEGGPFPSTKGWVASPPGSTTVARGATNLRGAEEDDGGQPGRVAPIRFDEQPDSLNSRFLPLPDLRTHAVFAVDDDIQVTCEDLGFALEVWRNARRTLVGFYPRVHTVAASGKALDYHSWWYVFMRGEYSMVLTKAALMHRDYLQLYSTAMPQQVRAYVDKHMNCEDVAMQFLVANHSGLPPVFVRGSLRDLGALGGISTRGGHMVARSDCLNDINRFFGGDHRHNALVMSHTSVGRASSWGANQPATWFEFIASDLPIPIWTQILIIVVAVVAAARALYQCSKLAWRTRARFSMGELADKRHHPKT